jgi:DNA (cytosine-5)-methyltransferase 1
MLGIDLFAGAGGMSLGASDAGIKVKFAVEIDRQAARTYALNHPTTTLENNDIRKISKSQLREWSQFQRELVVFGGPPCQGFSWSNARTRNTENNSNWLFKEFLRVVRTVEPAWVVFENVQGIVDTAQGVFLRQLCESLQNLGYSTTTARLNAVDHGVPQDRTRFFLVATNSEHVYRFPAGRYKRISVAQAIGDLSSLHNGHSDCWMPYGKGRPSFYARELRQQQNGCSNNLVTKNSNMILSRYRYVPQGGNWQDIPMQLMKNYTDVSRCHTGIYHRLRLDQPSIVIGNFRKNMLIHPLENRGLSVREAARIQSFPDRYIFCGSIGFQQQQVGNAVPPKLAYSVFREIVRLAEGAEK